jgi:peptide/nickel transport system substrate-binding protein
MAGHRQLLRVTVGGIVIASALLAWAGIDSVLAAPHGTVRIAFHSFSKESIDPAQDSGPGLVYHGQMFDNFIGATAEGKLTTDYGVLERYESNADATVWTFVLKKGITWHDGVEMTADDLKFSVDHYARPTTLCGQCGARQPRPGGGRGPLDRAPPSQAG